MNSQEAFSRACRRARPRQGHPDLLHPDPARDRPGTPPPGGHRVLHHDPFAAGLADRLRSPGVALVAMEATSDYWKPAVRHEVPRVRAEVEGLRLRSVAAGR